MEGRKYLWRKNVSRGENPEWHPPKRFGFVITICNCNDATQLHIWEVFYMLLIYKIMKKN